MQGPDTNEHQNPPEPNEGAQASGQTELGPHPAELLDINVFPSDMRPLRSTGIRSTIGDALNDMLGKPGVDKAQDKIVQSHQIYIQVLTIRGASQQEIEATNKRFSRELQQYHHSDPLLKSRRMQDLQRETDLLLAASFNRDTLTLQSLGATRNYVAEQEKAFDNAHPRRKLEIFSGLHKEFERVLVEEFPRLALAWNDMTPKFNIGQTMIAFDNSPDADKPKIAERLYLRIERSLKGRLHSNRVLLRALLVDGGLSPADAEEKSHLQTEFRSDLSLEDKLRLLEKSDKLVGEKALEDIDKHISLWEKIYGDPAVARRWKMALGVSSEWNRIKLAKKIYGKVQKAIDARRSEDLGIYERVLRDSGMDTPQIQDAVRDRETALINSPSSEQLEKFGIYEDL